MKRVLFVSNGHGEEAIAARIAREVRALAEVECDHLALVGEFGHPSVLNDVGPRRTMPSGGLIAMGNVRNIARDLRGGLVGHTLAQLSFVRGAHPAYDAAVAVGDVFALLMTLQVRRPTVYVGTAKSVYVAPYGPFEERVLRRARAIFVRDAATAERLRGHGLPAEAPGNVIVDLHSDGGAADVDDRLAGMTPLLALFPGSRPAAYDDARFLCAVVRELARQHPRLGAALSIAPGLAPERFATLLEGDGWRVEGGSANVPFVLFDGERALVRAWQGPIGALIARATLVLGQAGTANEAAAAGGVPVIAFARARAGKDTWYRMRQRKLLGEALLVASGGVRAASGEVAALLDDAARRVRMGAVGRERMGPAGGARAIARRIVEPA